MREAIILMALLYAYIAQYSAQTRHNALNIAQLRGMQRCPPHLHSRDHGDRLRPDDASANGGQRCNTRKICEGADGKDGGSMGRR